MSTAKKGWPSGRTLSVQHRNAISAGRAEHSAVARYLESLIGPVEIPGSTQAELRRLEAAAASAPPLERLELIQRRYDLERSSIVERRGAIEETFIKHAASYAERHGISYATWREFGVPTSILRRAGIGPRR